MDGCEILYQMKAGGRWLQFVMVDPGTNRTGEV